jgi:hypothetical protein
MAWTTILASQTDADSPLNQVLLDSIRENLDYLKGQSDTWGYVPLGGSAGETDGPQATEVPLGGAFNLQAPPSGKKWRLQVLIQGKKTSGTINLRLKLYDKTDTQINYVDGANLTSSYLDYTLTLDVTTAIWGRLAIWYHSAATGQAQSRNGAARAFLVDA